MEKLATDTHPVPWRAALWQLVSDSADVTKMERFISAADSDSPRFKASATLAIMATIAPQQPTAQPERIEQSGAVINGNAIARGDRALGSFPETPSFQSSSHMTTPAIPTRL